jgi:uncharacterized SAM-dependent methyltransferase
MTDSVFVNDLIASIAGKPAIMGRHLYADHPGCRITLSGTREVRQPMSGSMLWEKLADKEPTYPISRADTQLVLAHLTDIARLLPRNLTMIDLAPGGEKSIARSMELAKAVGIKRYRPKEASVKFNDASVEIAARHFSRRNIDPLPVGDVFAGAEDIKIDEPTLAYFGGGTISNLIHPISKKFPSQLLRETLQRLFTYAPHGWLLLSFDTTNDKASVLARYGSESYNDFIGNAMYRQEAEVLGIKGDGFVSTPQFIEESHQLAHIITATADQDTRLGRIEKGTKIHLVNSYKYTPDLFEKEVEAIGCFVDCRLFDARTGQILYMLRSPEAPARNVVPLLQPVG